MSGLGPVEWAALGFAGGWLACSALVVWLAGRLEPEDGPAGMAWKDRGE